MRLYWLHKAMNPTTRTSERNSDKLLFTPGPLTTSATVKAAMLRDLGSRDYEFIATVRAIRQKLLAIGGQPDESLYTTILLPGSGTYGVEAVLSSIVPANGRLLLIVNGAYGKRMMKIATVHKIETQVLSYAENVIPDLSAIEAALAADNTITTVAVVHCETTTGILNPIAAIGALVKSFGQTYIVDAMSSFGAIPIDLAACHIDYLISSSNKCIEGVPGFSFTLARKDGLIAAEGHARSLSLDLVAQWRELDASGQFRFTPPTHTLLAFHQALLELEAEGGVDGRAARYKANHDVLMYGMQAMGFRAYLAPDVSSYIISTVYYPTHPNFSFERFYQTLNEKGYVIYPGKLGEVDCFRIGNIGRLYPADLEGLLAAVQETLHVMQIPQLGLEAR